MKHEQQVIADGEALAKELFTLLNNHQPTPLTRQDHEVRLYALAHAAGKQAADMSANPLQALMVAHHLGKLAEAVVMSEFLGRQDGQEKP